MPSGGKRVRSGPAKDPNSEKSRRLGYTLQSLPNTECRMKPPEWPLEPADDERVRKLEAEKWKWLWKLPQARAWHLPQFKWMIHGTGVVRAAFHRMRDRAGTHGVDRAAAHLRPRRHERRRIAGIRLENRGRGRAEASRFGVHAPQGQGAEPGIGRRTLSHGRDEACVPASDERQWLTRIHGSSTSPRWGIWCARGSNVTAGSLTARCEAVQWCCPTGSTGWRRTVGASARTPHMCRPRKSPSTTRWYSTRHSNTA